MPNGLSPVMAGVIVVIFSLGGSAIAAVAAGESENPRQNVIRAIKSVILRVMLFYVGSVSILILCLPWTDKAYLASPYVSLFSLAGFGGAAVAMKLVLSVSFMSVTALATRRCCQQQHGGNEDDGDNDRNDENGVPGRN